MIEQALDYYQNGNYEAAHALYIKMLEDEPGNHEVLYMLSLCRQHQNMWPEAISYLYEAIDNYPDNPLYHYAVGGLHMRTGDIQRALVGYRKASELRPNDPRARIGIGYALLSNNELDAANDALKAALRAADDQPEVKATAMAHLGVIALQQQGIDDALLQLQNAAELKPDDTYIQTHLGRAFMAKGQSGFAIQCFRNAQNLSGQQYQHDPLLLLWLGQALEHSGDLAGAVNTWRDMLQNGYEHPDPLYHLARAHLHGNQPQQALNLLLRAKKLVPDAQPVKHLLATAWQQTGQWDAARRELESLPDTDHIAQRQLTRLHLSQSRYSQAEEIATRLVRDGEDADLLLAAQVAAASHQPEQAHRYLNQLDQVAQSSVPGTWIRAIAYASNDPVQANQQLEQLTKLPEVSADILQSAKRLSARIQHDLGEYDAAWETLDELPKIPCSMLQVIIEPSPKAYSEPSQSGSLFDRDQILSWPPKPPGRSRLSPVFVLGWPGSERQKLLQALARHNEIDVVRDRPVQVNEAADRYASSTDRRYLITWPRSTQQLGQVNETNWIHIRNKYRKQLIQLIGAQPAQVVIDSLEVPAAGLLAIQRYYPDATIIHLQHDVKDLQVSWRWRGYEHQQALLAAYRAEQGLLEQARQALALPWLDLSTQQILSDPKAALTPVMEHFNLGWDDSMAEPLTPTVLTPPIGAGEHYPV